MSSGSNDSIGNNPARNNNNICVGLTNNVLKVIIYFIAPKDILSFMQYSSGGNGRNIKSKDIFSSSHQ